MGLTFSSLFQSLGQLIRWSKDQDVRILMLGLDSAGKVRSHHHSGKIPQIDHDNRLLFYTDYK